MSLTRGMVFATRGLDRWEEIIRPAILRAGLEPYRMDITVASVSVLVDIMWSILDAKLLLFDINTNERGARNGNVMYEIGPAHAMRHPEEILITRSDTQSPC